MKKLLATVMTLLFLAPVAQAQGLAGGDLKTYLILRYELYKTFETSKRRASMSPAERTAEQRKREKKNREYCIETFDTSKTVWKKYQEKEGNFQDVVHMKEKFLTSEIKDSPVHPDYQVARYGNDHKYIRGLANKRFTKVGWTTAMSIPHSRPGCNSLWTVANVQVVEWEDKTCRRVEFQFEQRSYHTLMCGDDHNIYLDYSGDLSENMLLKNDRSCDNS